MSANNCSLLLTKQAGGWSSSTHTFTCVTVPEYVFGIRVSFDLVDGRGPPHAVDAASGEGVGQGAGGVVDLCHVQFLPGEFGRRVVDRFRTDAGLGRVVAGTDQAVQVVVLSGRADALSGGGEALQGH